MAFPEGVPTRRVTAGRGISIERGTPLAVRLTVRSERGVLVWAATGDRLMSAPARADAGRGAAAELVLPCTDSDGWLDDHGRAIDVSEPDSYTHRYVAEVSGIDSAGRTVATQEVVFVLPAGDTPMDLDKGIEAGSVEGGVIVIPADWSKIADEAREAADRAEQARDEAEAIAAAPDGIRENADRAEAARVAAEQARDDALAAQAGAETAETAAGASAAAAASSETAAGQSATDAGQSATAAGTSASAAESARADAVAAQQVAEDAVAQLDGIDEAVADAEAARDAASSYRDQAATARTGAQTARSGAEQARDAAQAIADGMGDTGWINLTSYLADGYTGSLFGLVKNGDIELRGSITGSLPAGNTTVTDPLPDPFVGHAVSARGVAYITGGAVGVVTVQSAGLLVSSPKTATFAGILLKYDQRPPA